MLQLLIEAMTAPNPPSPDTPIKRIEARYDKLFLGETLEISVNERQIGKGQVAHSNEVELMTFCTLLLLADTDN